MLVADDEPDDEPGGEPDAETDGALVADGAAAAAPLARGFVWSVGLEAARPAEEPWNPP